MAVYWQAPIVQQPGQNTREGGPQSSHDSSSPLTSTPARSEASVESSGTERSQGRRRKKRAKTEHLKELTLIGPSTFTTPDGITHQMPRLRFMRGDGEKMTKLELEDLSTAMTNAGTQAIQIECRPVFKKVNFTCRRNTREERATPPVSEDGRRYCGDCGSEVRPQACGRYEHRWRCIGKNHRKWYGVVKPHEVQSLMPCKQNRDSHPKSISRHEKHKANLQRALDAIVHENQSEEPTTSQIVPGRTVQVQMDAEPDNSFDPSEQSSDPWEQSSNTSSAPSTSCYAPPQSGAFTDLQDNMRWWRDHQPRSLPPYHPVAGTPLELSAMLHTIGDTMRKVAELHMRNPESVSTSASLDLMMDSLFSSIGPIITTGVSMIPGVKLDPKVKSKTWNEALERTPLPPR